VLPIPPYIRPNADPYPSVGEVWEEYLKARNAGAVRRGGPGQVLGREAGTLYVAFTRRLISSERESGLRIGTRSSLWVDFHVGQWESIMYYQGGLVKQGAIGARGTYLNERNSATTGGIT
jgi:hypothetical protein